MFMYSCIIILIGDSDSVVRSGALVIRFCYVIFAFSIMVIALSAHTYFVGT